MEETLFETESRQSREDIAATLRMIADRLDAHESVTLSAGEQEITVTPPAQPTFEVKVEREGDEMSLEVELEWGPDESDGSSDLQIS